MSSPLGKALEAKTALLPAAPGVYLLKDKNGAIIYVGKAKSLRRRVQSYAKQHTARRPDKVQAMVSQIFDLEHIVTTTEKEALILEGTLIKRHRPRYNVILKDDKNYPCIKLSLGEQFPRLSLVRRVKKDTSLYFGPFTSAQAVRETLKVIHQHFLLRKCQSKTFQFRQRPCLNYQMGQCPAPCFRLIDEECYRGVVKEVEFFLQGKNRELIRMLERLMAEESEKLNFEAAAKVRDRITSLRKTLEHQKTVTLDFTDRDVIALHRDEQCVTLVILFMRNGQLIGSKDFTLAKALLPDKEIISSLVNQFYGEGRLIPKEILIPCPLEDQGVIQEALRERKGGRVDLITPRKGTKTHLIELARLNAESVFKTNEHKKVALEAGGAELEKFLHLKHTPAVIECYDISNWGGRQAVGSMVQFKDGEPVKSNYRRFKIRGSEGADDCGMLYEVLRRRCSRGTAMAPLPDLIVVDGGRGQLNAARKVMHDLHLELFDIIALAKGKKRGGSGVGETQKTPEQIFIPHRKNPVILPSRSAALLLLERIRDESHRFALSYHKRLSRRENLHSSLEAIPGIGEKMRSRLLRHFASVENLKKATVSELCQVPLVQRKTAEKIHRFFSSEGHTVKH